MSENEKLAHLLRRTGFGVRGTELRRAAAEGFETTMERILHQLFSASEPTDSPPVQVLPSVVFPITLLTFSQGIAWWLEQMVSAESGLSEKLTLFWHRHFATSGAKVFRPGYMFAQNLTLRRHASGPFAELLKAMMSDPALLNWLDADRAPSANPNENLGRELLELFTVGRGQYTETDVKELSKLTTQNGHLPINFMGRKGAQNFDEVLERLAVHPATAARITDKLWSDFVAGPCSERERQRLIRLWSKTRGNVAVVLREMLRSPEFLGGSRRRVMSPVEFAVSCWRLLGVDGPRIHDVQGFEGAGELVFFPPNVKGWNSGLAWIHPAAVQMRWEFVARAVSHLSEDHFALLGLNRTELKGQWLSSWSGGQVRPSLIEHHIKGLEARESLMLALNSPDFWTC